MPRTPLAAPAQTPIDARRRAAAAVSGAGALNLVKLCVGAESVADLAEWQNERSRELARALGDPRPRHRTRMAPKRAAELLDGGSLYWVVKGVIRCRQRLEALEPAIGEDGLQRVDLVLAPEIVAVLPRPMRPFQGWRYMAGADAPRDAPFAGAAESADAALPPTLERALVDLGVL